MEKSLRVQMYDDGQMEVISVTQKTVKHCNEYVTEEEQALFQKIMGCTACEQIRFAEKQNSFCCLRCYVFFHHNRSLLLDSKCSTCVASS